VDSSVSIVTRLRPGWPVPILDRGWEFSLCHRVQTGPVSTLPHDYRGLFTRR